MPNTPTAEPATPAQLTAAIALWTNCLGKGTAAQRAATETTLADLKARLSRLKNETMHEVVRLEFAAHRARQSGRFDAAVGLIGVADALRSGQLTPHQLHNDTKRTRLFGGHALGL